MIVTIKNAKYEALLCDHGAEIHSLRRVKDGASYIWNGSPDVWKYHAPILFPHVGRILDGYAFIDGKKCEFGVNGFARDLDHTLVFSSETKAVFELSETEQTLEKYPFRFTLKTEYEITEEGLSFKTTVTNTDDKPIRFSLGSHTAFCCPRNTDAAGTEITDYQIEFEKREALRSVVCTPEGYLAFGEDDCAPFIKPYGEKEAGIIPLTGAGFGNGHFFTAFSSAWVGLRNKKDGSLVKVRTDGFPYLMIWQNAGVPQFVCIEPWFGTPDPSVTNHEWDTKPALIELAPEKSFTSDQSVIIG
ncbi:MAG: hypothetical protein NC041_03115 [Bacteroides sp.]|nr:hypothetical protein [Prevotella sp.]MCM1408399.1 aldose 1-epimerase family protein [Treponema brennaborense]MCM1469439.1 hypothetical protein [Bacteroides sp.]